MTAEERIINEELLKTKKEIQRIYAQAAEDIRKKYNDFLAKKAVKSKQLKAKVNAGEMTEEAYQDWLNGQVFIGKQWESKAKEIATTMTHATEQAATIVNGSRINVMTESMNHGLYELEKGLKLHTNFDLFNTASVTKMIRESPRLLPEWKINEKKDYLWNYNKVKDHVTQGIIQGESIPQIAKRLTVGLQTDNGDRMTMFARTAMTGAHNAGRQELAEEAEEEEGVEVKKMWVATLDDRTRDSHAELDGQVVPVDEPFVVVDSDGKRKEIMFPGDPNCEYPELVYNCRCTMKEIYKKTPAARQRRAYREVVDENGKVKRESYITDATTYKEWKAMKKEE